MKKALALIISLSFATFLQAQWTNGQAADRVLGQPNLTSVVNHGSTTSTSFSFCSGIAIDVPNGKMYVVDQNNNRVLRYSYPITSDEQAA